MTGLGDLLLGAHVSIAGGVHKAVDRGVDLGCTAIQIFTKNATRWRAKPLADEEAELFKSKREDSGILVVAHDSYLINLASPDRNLWKKSTGALEEEVRRCDMLGVSLLVIHPGSHMGSGEKEGLGRVISALNRVMERTSDTAVMIVVENTAGQGSSLGHSFDHLADILDECDRPDRLGFCLDTCHAFAAGYDMRGEAGCNRVLEEFDRAVGLRRLEVLHLNDSLKGLGSRVDRHEHIGRGELGLECFRTLVRDLRFRDIPKLMETPNLLHGKWMDPINLGILKDMAAEP